METDLFNIYNDNASPITRLPLALPGGGCNFSDLHSPLGLKCGCRRFYSRQPAEQTGWCMCNHHACYHDQVPSPDDQLLAVGQENEPPSRSGREPLSPLAGSEWKDPAGLAPGPLSFIHDPPVELDCRSVADSSLPDTLAWGEATTAPGLTPVLPPIPSQCLLSSQASTTSSAQVRLLRPFGGKGLVTLKHVDESSLSRQTGFLSRSEPRTAGAVSLDALKDLTSAVSDHGHRLDRLETASFHGECHDRLENAEVRVYELESRVEDVEKLVGDGGSTVISCALGPDDVDPSHEVKSQLQSLQAQVAQLQTLLPSHQHPWKIDVVFLPFPLKRVWQELHHFKEPSTQGGGDAWTQSNVTRRSQSPFVRDWASSDRDTRWLQPRACSITSIVAKRLRSRGLIRKITISRPDHQAIQAAVGAAFEDVFREMGIAPRPHQLGPLGLHQSWVPLRKVHLESRLRFLSPAEMVTPGLWDAQFLSSVLMRSSRRTLFITHPDGYLQDRQAYSNPWTWERVREMSRVYPDESDSSEVPEADAFEECWAWTGQLDEEASKPMPRKAKSRLVRSFSAQPQQRLSSPSVAISLQARRRDSTTAMTPLLMRTGSSPQVGMAAPPRQPSSPPASRRVVSNGRPSPSARVRKRRRRTRSRSHQRYFTPRWTASPSPMPTMGFYDRQRGMTPFAYATPYSMAPPLPEVVLLCGETPTRSRRMSMMDLDGDSGSEESYVGGEEEEEGGEEEEEADEEEEDDEDEDEEEDNSDEEKDDDDDDDDDDDRYGPRAGAFPLLPEDEPWPGIEEADVDGNGNGEKEAHNEEGGSETSSQPSEYPTRREVDETTALWIYEDRG